MLISKEVVITCGLIDMHGLAKAKSADIVATFTCILTLKIQEIRNDVYLTFIQDVTGRAGCTAGQEVLPDGEDQASGIQAPAAEESAALHHREKEGHCSSCQKRPGKGEFRALLEKVLKVACQEGSQLPEK